MSRRRHTGQGSDLNGGALLVDAETAELVAHVRKPPGAGGTQSHSELMERGKDGGLADVE